jgi:dihydropteroate synthase
MAEVISRHQATCIIGHLPGNDIQAAHAGKLVDDINQVTRELLRKAARLERAGLRTDQIILDPGIGFGKTPDINQKLLRFAEEVPTYKVMIGYSRKRFLGENRLELEPNLRAGQIAAAAGAAYLRVHDVAGHRQLLR